MIEQETQVRAASLNPDAPSPILRIQRLASHWTVFVAVVLGLATVIDSALWPLSLLAITIYGGIAIAFGYLWLGSHSRRMALIASLVILLGLLGVYFTAWNTRKPFLRDLAKVKQGMTPVQVEAIMGRYIHDPGWTPSKGSTNEFPPVGAVYFRHATSGNYNSDFGIVLFKDGLVVETQFLPD